MDFSAVNRRRLSCEMALGPGAKKDGCFRRLFRLHDCTMLLFEWTTFTHRVLFAVCINILFITPLVLSEKVLFVLVQTNTSQFDSVGSKTKLLNRPIKAIINCQNLQRYKFASFVGWRFLSYKKKDGSKTTNHSPLA